MFDCGQNFGFGFSTLACELFYKGKKQAVSRALRDKRTGYFFDKVLAKLAGKNLRGKQLSSRNQSLQ